MTSEREPLISQETVRNEDENLEISRRSLVDWRKVDFRLLPPVTMTLLLSFVVRINVSNAFVAGMKDDLQMSNNQYSILITTLLVPYILAMIPAGLMLKKVGAGIVLPLMTIFSGVVTILQGFVTSFWMLLVLRAMLGLFQGGLIPCITLYVSEFYPKNMLQFRIAVFFSCAAFAGAFSGLISAAILKMDGVLKAPGWAWLFRVEGILTTLFGLCSLKLIPDGPLSAIFLTTEERGIITELQQDNDREAEAETASKVSDFLTVIQKPHVLLLSIITLFGGTTETGLGLFEPLVVRGLGFDGILAQLMSAPPFLAGFLLSLITGYLSDKHGSRGITTIVCSSLCVIGFFLFLVPVTAIRYFSLFLSLSGSFASVPAIAAWASNNISPYSHRAIALSLLSINSTLGGFLSAWILGTLSAPPNYTLGTIVFAVLSLGEVVAAAGTLRYFMKENVKRRAVLEGVETGADGVGRGDASVHFTYAL